MKKIFFLMGFIFGQNLSNSQIIYNPVNYIQAKGIKFFPLPSTNNSITKYIGIDNNGVLIQTDKPTLLSQFTNDTNFVTSASISGKEDTVNKVNNFNTINSTLFPTTNAVQQYTIANYQPLSNRLSNFASVVPTNGFLLWNGTNFVYDFVNVDLGINRSAIDIEITNTNGTTAFIPLATGLLAGLTTNDFTTTLKNKLDNLPTSFFNGQYSSLSGIPATFTPSSHTHTISDITNLQTSLDGKQDNLVSGTNIKTINGNSLLGSGDLVISAGETNLTTSQTATNVTINSDTGTDASISLANGTNAGVSINNYTTAEQTKLAGIATGATANSSDATLLSRANHTGTQTSSTISDFATTAKGLFSFVAGSGAYNSTTGGITIPTNTNQLTNGANYITNATGLVTAGSNVSLSGNGTIATPYVINASSGGELDEDTTIWTTDFLTASTTANPPFVGSAISTGTNATNNTNLTGNNTGVVRMTSSTTANSGYRWQTDLTTIRIKGGEEFTCIINPANFATTTMRAGLHDATTSADAVDGVYFEYSATGNVVLKTSNNSTRSTSATITTLSLNTWYKLKLVVNSNATSVTGSVYDSTGALISSQTLTANIPTGAGREVGAGIIVTNSGTVATALLDLDYMKLKQILIR